MSTSKSILKRYLAVTMGVVVASLILLGVIMVMFFGWYWRQEKKELLTQNAISVSNIAGPFIASEEAMSRADLFRSFVESIAVSADADILITNTEGEVLLAATQKLQVNGDTVIPGPVVEAAIRGQLAGRHTLGIYPGRYYVIGVPLISQSTGQTLGAVFAATSASAMNAYQWALMRIYITAAAMVLIIAFCVAGLFAYRMVMPLRQMSSAARSFGAGDFSVRVPVTSADELGQLAVSFNNMANSLSISEGTRRSFIANVSHELKTPMTTISGFIDGILDGTIPREEQDKYLHIVSGETRRLSRLVRSMLDLSRIDNGEMKLNPTRFDITNTIVTTLLTFEQAINERQIEILGLEDAMPQMVYGDQDLLHQVIYNLTENAVKFTNPGGTIELRVIDGIDRTTVVIQNSGQGIAPEDLPMIFERFYKTDKSRSQDKNGMGLGLYIVKTIVKLHGGEITVRSVAGEYCRFEFYVPKPQEAPRLKEPAARSRDPRIREGKGRENGNGPERS